MKYKTVYKTVWAVEDVAELDRKVNNAMEAGFIPNSCLVIDRSGEGVVFYHQTMIAIIPMEDVKRNTKKSKT